MSRYRQHRRAAGVLAAVVVLAAVAAGLLGPTGASAQGPATVPAVRVLAAPQVVVPDERHAHGVEDALTALATVKPRYLGGGTRPAAWWDRCGTITYAIDTAGLKGSGLSAKDERAWVKRSLSVVAKITGYRFKDVGAATVRPSSTSLLPVKQTRGKAAELLITFGSASSGPRSYRVPDLLAGGVAGVGGAAWRGTEIGAGFVVLDAADLAGFGGAQGSKVGREIYLHEVGHAMGLDHVDHGRQIMYPTARGTLSAYGSVDVKGLKALAAKPCVN